MPTERFTFPGHSGDKLAARLDLPDGPHLATAVFAHCFTCGKDITAARRIAARLSGMGIAVLRFDFTGLGHSGGEFENTTFSSNIADLEAAAEALSKRGMAPSLLIGHSLGGAAVLSAGQRIEGIRAIATIGAPFHPGHVTANFRSDIDRIQTDGVAEVNLGGRPFRIGRDFVQDVETHDLEDGIGALRAALLVLHGPLDAIVGIDNAAQIFAAARHPKSFVTLDDADHLLSRAEDAEYVAEVIAAWAGRYLDLRPPAPPPGVPEGIVRVTEADATGFLQDIQGGPHHHILADEPITYGGTNRGLSPYGLLSAGLGACTSMTIRMYARRKGWPLDGVSVEVVHNKSHAQDAATGSQERVDRFTRTVHLTGALSDDQRQRLLEIADKCPVHRTMENASVIETALAPADPA
ncbi:OsmC family protein [Loktanella sp. IMCC34160]|uniref:bifunctional alpha/beta hydrolase/OsmC family protein n=1 Tax=Loktanella sp. IMCC34160 TaxID=2510646 RepID=UPI00101D7F05|nr:bifunctional alpha/beta hydrolase/OsmC family protein [Loktanella sp. IMCC34160]RYG91895.1 OsmC family protein [Loktanella sp. IMCC34160]